MMLKAFAHDITSTTRDARPTGERASSTGARLLLVVLALVAGGCEQAESHDAAGCVCFCLFALLLEFDGRLCEILCLDLECARDLPTTTTTRREGEAGAGMSTAAACWSGEGMSV